MRARGPSRAFHSVVGGGRARGLRDFLAGGPLLLTREMEICEGSITVAEVEKVLVNCPRGKSPELNGLPYEIYKSMSGTCWPMFMPSGSRTGGFLVL